MAELGDALVSKTSGENRVGSIPTFDTNYARVMELGDILVLETSAERREGSSPSLGTK